MQYQHIKLGMLAVYTRADPLRKLLCILVTCIHGNP